MIMVVPSFDNTAGPKILPERVNTSKHSSSFPRGISNTQHLQLSRGAREIYTTTKNVFLPT